MISTFFFSVFEKKKKDVPRPTACTKFMKYDVCMFFGKTIRKNVAKCIRDVNAQCCADSAVSEFMGKTFQAAQLTHERFLAIDHSCKIFFDICQTELPPTFGV